MLAPLLMSARKSCAYPIAIGCYTATKLVVLQGITDYYRRVRPNDQLFKRVVQRIWQNGDPLVNVEPGD